MNEPRVEQAILEDLPALTDLLLGLFEQESDFQPDRAKQTRGLRLIIEHPVRGRIFVLRKEGKVVGMVSLLFTISTAEGGFAAMMEDLVVHPDHRGQGYGSMLMQHAIRYAQEKKFMRITLLSDASEVEARRFLKKHGFVDSAMVPLRLILN